MCPDGSQSFGSSGVGSPSTSWGTPGGLSDTSDGSSSPSNAPSGASPPVNNPSSNSSSSTQKRKTLGNDGNNDAADDQIGDGDDGPDRPSKRAKATQQPTKPRYDCPIARRAIHQDDAVGSSPACALGGLEFRNVWYAYSILVTAM